ncbi:hypothetical protein DL98DRAFT_537399 [Cadophora sp. DSE1049]|nr:hypothetical protein DL98DRAFT_537399 [Cadophora sp. DSE1049]
MSSPEDRNGAMPPKSKSQHQPFPWTQKKHQSKGYEVLSTGKVPESTATFRPRAPAAFSFYPKSWNDQAEEEWARIKASDNRLDKWVVRNYNAAYDEQYERERDARFRKVEERREKKRQLKEAKRLEKEKRETELEECRLRVRYKRAPCAQAFFSKSYNDKAEAEWARMQETLAGEKRKSRTRGD